jgi:transcriptional regulator with XRE-family HTH domain
VPTASSELGDFLRARREALRPADVGLPDSGRRRTPGLRREEVATLADVSVDYVVRLEQGRDTNPSPEVQSALARALRLTPPERRHLAMLAARTNHGGACPEVQPVRQEAPAAVRLLLEQIDVPAHVTGPVGDVVAWNEGWEELVRPLGILDEPHPNLSRYVFLDPRARVAFADWDEVATEHVARLRAAAVHWADDPVLAVLLEELQRLDEFAARWKAHDVARPSRAEERLRHPHHGDLVVVPVVLDLPGDDAQQLVAWLPASPASAAAFGDAAPSPAAGPPRLRVVGDA